MNDLYYSQWCMMHIPFRSLRKFGATAAIQKVPDRYRWFATALLLTDAADCEPPALRKFWQDPARLAEDMQREGCGDAYMQQFVAALTIAVDRYVAGQLDKAEEDAGVQARTQHRTGGGGQPAAAEVRTAARAVFQGRQLRFYKLLAERVALSLKVQQSKDDADGDRLRGLCWEAGHRPVVCSGRPGTGKTTVAHENVRQALAGGASVLAASPTARMAARMRSKLGNHPQLTIDTFAAAFQLHRPEQEALFAMYGYNLVVVDEFSQLGQDDFERILRLWAADKAPALVFLGDKYQLPGIAPRRAWESSAWNSMALMFLELVQVFRCEDPAFLDTLQLLRTSMPSPSELLRICCGHKAWVGDAPSALVRQDLAAHSVDVIILLADIAGEIQLGATIDRHVRRNRPSILTQPAPM